MQPVGLSATRVKVNGDVVDVLLELPVQRGAKPTAPCFPLLRIPHYRLSMRTRLAPVSTLVVLIKRIGPPETLIAIRTWVLPPPLVELLQVPLPVELPLERLIARRAPKLAVGRLVRCR